VVLLLLLLLLPLLLGHVSSHMCSLFLCGRVAAIHKGGGACHQWTAMIAIERQTSKFCMVLIMNACTTLSGNTPTNANEDTGIIDNKVLAVTAAQGPCF
jgi:hypothetical protein